MRPTPTERDRSPMFTTAEPARARRARGLLPNVPEAAAPDGSGSSRGSRGPAADPFVDPRRDQISRRISR